MALNSGFPGGILTAPILERLVEVLLVEAPLSLRIRGPRGAGVARGSLGSRAGPHTAGDPCRRRAFAERFARKGGMPPMHYLLEWRVALAKEILRSERPSLDEVAERVGYQSASAFSTAFTRVTGSSPRKFTRLGAAPDRDRATRQRSASWRSQRCSRGCSLAQRADERVRVHEVSRPEPLGEPAHHGRQGLPGPDGLILPMVQAGPGSWPPAAPRTERPGVAPPPRPAGSTSPHRHSPTMHR
jgi:AraC-like DNA-binding protein